MLIIPIIFMICEKKSIYIYIFFISIESFKWAFLIYTDHVKYISHSKLILVIFPPEIHRTEQAIKCVSVCVKITALFF